MNLAGGLLALVALTLVASHARAFDAKCYSYGDTSLQPSAYSGGVPLCGGVSGARQRWIGPGDEHRQLFEAACDLATIPIEARSTLTLTVFTDGGGIDPTGSPTVLGSSTSGSIPTVIASAFDKVTTKQKRHISAGEFSQLPDMAYAFWDWATGAETCPVNGTSTQYASAEACHTYPSHIAPFNSGHFSPQNRNFFSYYHQLALARADACRALHDAIGAANLTKFRDPYILDCEKEALLIEAIAQHYLQDAWATGHMFERWGSPNIDDFPGGAPVRSSASDPRRARAALVALTAGAIHGAASIEAALNQKIGGAITVSVNDPLCGPLDPSSVFSVGDPIASKLHATSFIRFADASPSARYLGVGDLYADRILNGTYSEQQKDLIACSAASLSEVYAATAQDHGHAGSYGGMPAPSQGDAFYNSCFSQRVTNASVYFAMGIDIQKKGGTFDLARVSFDGRESSELVANFVIDADAQIASNTESQANVILGDALKAQYSRALTDMAKSARRRAFAAPNGTDLASGGLGSLVGVEPNGFYAALHKDVPANYVDPPMPWIAASTASSQDDLKRLAIARTFHRAHVADWCSKLTMGDLDAMKAAATGKDLKSPQCEACVEFARRHLRTVPEGRASRETDPVCAVIDDKAAIIYDLFDSATNSSPGPENWCGCAPKGFCGSHPAEIAPCGGTWASEADANEVANCPYKSTPTHLSMGSCNEFYCEHHCGTPYRHLGDDGAWTRGPPMPSAFWCCPAGYDASPDGHCLCNEGTASHDGWGQATFPTPLPPP